MKSVKCLCGGLLWVVMLSTAQFSADSFAQDAGPHYFVTDEVNPVQHYWRRKQSFAGVDVHTNFNLLAYQLGDRLSAAPAGRELLRPQFYSFSDTTGFSIRPFATQNRLPAKVTQGIPRLQHAKGMRLGYHLKTFLNDPLSGGKFDLSLPFSSPNVGLSTRSALMRTQSNPATDRVWHVGIDFDVNWSSSSSFEVLAPAAGEIIGYKTNTGNGQASMVIRHVADNGAEFLTIYQHLDLRSTPVAIAKGKTVERGDFLGEILPVLNPRTGVVYAHLHFAVAVWVQGGYVPVGSGWRIRYVPGAWYLIDPFGVYDYRHPGDNYLPNNRLTSRILDQRHAQVFQLGPLSNSLQ